VKKASESIPAVIDTVERAMESSTSADRASEKRIQVGSGPEG
jgi:hypothetical protein